MHLTVSWLLAMIVFFATLQLRANGQSAPGKIARTNRVLIRVAGEPDLTLRGRISSAGAITMPLIGTVPIEGLTTREAATAISRRLADGYLANPQVSVAIEKTEARKRVEARKASAPKMISVFVVGQVQRPGMLDLPLDRGLTVSKAVRMSGGVTPLANPRKVQLKRLTAAGVSQLHKVNLSDVASGRQTDPLLRNGDVITVPESLF